jgi:hypothetical protein
MSVPADHSDTFHDSSERSPVSSATWMENMHMHGPETIMFLKSQIYNAIETLINIDEKNQSRQCDSRHSERNNPREGESSQSE